MVAVPKPSLRVRQQLPALSELIGYLADVATRLPREAARTMMLAVQHDHRRNVDPYGHQQAPVRMARGGRAWAVRRYDAKSVIAENYYPVVEGTDAIIANDHRASRALQVPDKRWPDRRVGRRSHPAPGEGLGAWARRIQKMNRDLMQGARIRAVPGLVDKLKADAESRRISAHEKRNAGRIAKGQKALPYRTRAVRKDRARIDALVAKATA